MGAHELAFIGLAGSGLGTALGVPMVWPRTQRPLDVQLLGRAVLLMSAMAALISARLAGLAPASAEVEHAINLLGLCACPVLVAYTRYATAAPVTRRTAVWWLLPAGGYVMYVASRTILGTDSRVPFAWMLPILLGFTVASISTLLTRGGDRRSSLVRAEWMVAFVVTLNAAQIVRMEFGHVGPVRALVPLVLAAGFLAATAFLVWRIVAATPLPTGTAEPAPRYERSGLEEALAPTLLRRIDEALNNERLFARADLTLADLARAVDATPHQVSEVLNRYARVSFSDLINRRRVEDVKAQLQEPSSDLYTIEGIGATAGFGSRSALYAAFRRYERRSPAAFRASHRK